jgi:hypothetical protein
LQVDLGVVGYIVVVIAVQFYFDRSPLEGHFLEARSSPPTNALKRFSLAPLPVLYFKNLAWLFDSIFKSAFYLRPTKMSADLLYMIVPQIAIVWVLKSDLCHV